MSHADDCGTHEGFQCTCSKPEIVIGVDPAQVDPTGMAVVLVHRSADGTYVHRLLEPWSITIHHRDLLYPCARCRIALVTCLDGPVCCEGCDHQT